MDPDACLKELRECISAIRQNIDDSEEPGEEGDEDRLIELAAELASHSSRVCELFDGLDEWLKKQGFLPKDWERK